MTKTIESVPPSHASVIKRFAAMFYDGLLLFGILFTATLIPSLILSPTQQENSNGDIVYELHPLMSGIIFQLYLLSIVIIFFCYFWHKQGQTLGMQAWKIKLVDNDGNNPSLKQCLLRLAYASVSLSCFGLGYFWYWMNKDRLTWHDKWSNTRVLQLKKNNE